MPVFQTDSFQEDALAGDIAVVAGAGLCDTLGGLNFGSMLFWATTGLGVHTSLWNDSRASPVVYSGPGDLVGSAVGWWGLRAYALAKVGSNCVRLVRASDSTQKDFVTLANGGVDVASITTFLNGTTGKVVTLYDQSGNGNDLTQATDANRIPFSLTVLGTWPALANSASTTQLVTAGNVSSGAQPWTMVSVAKRTGQLTSAAAILSVASGSINIGYDSSNNTARVYAGTGAADATASDGTWHSLIGIGSGASSVLCVDGTSTTVSAGTNTATGPAVLGNDTFGNFFSGNLLECGIWGGSFTAGQRASMSSNQKTFWGY